MRRSWRPAFFLVVLAVVLLAGDTSFAGGYGRGYGHYGHGHYHGSGGGVGVFYGWPAWRMGWYYPGPYYYPSYYPYYPYYPYSSYYPAGVTVQSSPPVYIERGKPSEPPPAPSVWFYCPASKSYYPYVRECPGGWESVPAQPPEPER